MASSTHKNAEFPNRSQCTFMSKPIRKLLVMSKSLSQHMSPWAQLEHGLEARVDSRRRDIVCAWNDSESYIYDYRRMNYNHVLNGVKL
eukprot:4464917-Amphidinium_carterae.1